MRLIVGGPLYPQPAVDGDKVRWAALVPELARLAPLQGVFGILPPKERRNPEFDRLFEQVSFASTTTAGTALRAGLLEVRGHASAYGRRATPGWRRLLREAIERAPGSGVLLLGPSAGVIDAIGAPAVIDLLDVRSRLRTLSGDRLTGRRTLAAELLLAKRFPIMLASEADRRWLIQHGAADDRIALVPHGVDRRFFELSPEPESRTILFVGNLRYRPNLQGLRWFLDTCWPLMRGEGIGLRLVGFAAGRAGKPRDSTVFQDVADVRPHYEAASLAVVPLLEARGTQFKVLEAMAAGLPVVCTPPVAAGLFADHPAIVCDAPAQVASACRSLLSDPEARLRRGEAGRAYVRKHHDWAASARMIYDLLESASRHSSGRAATASG